MNDSLNLNEILSEIEINRTIEKIKSDEVAFGNLVEVLSLTKETDFMFSNLAGVDFSNADLRGFNFYGADLRASFGVNVIFDITTNFEGADVSDSCFASFVREAEVFKKNPGAIRFYDSLRNGDALEVSSWIHSRYGGASDSSFGLAKIDAETASIICRKLLFDDIDITKRTDLLYRLKNICGSPLEMRELMLDVLARHLDNYAIVYKLVSIVAKEFRGDFTVFQAILALTRDSQAQIRKIAFFALTKGKYFYSCFDEIRESLMRDENRSIRVELIRRSAFMLGRPYLEVINKSASRDEMSLGETFDYEQMLNLDAIEELALIIDQRSHKNKERSGGRKNSPSEAPIEASQSTIYSVINRQEEVLANAQLINLFFEKQYPRQALQAKARLIKKKKL